MKISFENPDKVNGLLTLTVETADFQERVNKTLKDYRKKANVPGFRPGMVPMGMIKKQFGEAVKAEEINKIIGEEIYKYVNDNKIKMLGEPMASESQVPVDLSKDAPYEFKFDIAVAPEFKVELSDKDTVDFYTIKVDDDLVNRQIDMFASRAGHYDKVEEYQANDMLKGDIRELDENGNTKEGGITVEGAVLMPEYIKVEDQKKLFDGAKLGDIITFNPKKAYPESDVEMLEELKNRGKNIAVVSNKFYAATQEICRHFFGDLVDVAIGERENIKKKPAPDTVNEALRQLHADRERAVYIGDSDVDVMTAKNSGMPCISVLWGFRDHDFLLAHGASILVSSPLQIL